jgi:hypothetical protein
MSDANSIRVEIDNTSLLRVYQISGLKVTSGFNKSLTVLLEKFDELSKKVNDE